MSAERRGPAICNVSNIGEGKDEMTKASIDLQDLRRRIYVKAKAEPHWRFWGLYVHVCKMETLRAAYEMAKSNNGAPGSDGVTFEAIEEQGVVKLIVEPSCEADFQPGSFGYRPKRSAQQAVIRVADAIAMGKTHVIDLDLKAYFDGVRHDVLLAKVARRISDDEVLHLLKIILKANGKRGVPQGGVISPVLSNLYLNEVDQMLERARERTRRGKYTAVEYARFADDVVILIHPDPRNSWLLKAVDRRLREELAKLDVQINEEKSRTVDLAQGESFGFLGFDFRRVRSLAGRWRPQYAPKMKKRTALLQKLREIFRRHRSQPVQWVVEHINPILRGWVNYFAIGYSSRCFQFVKRWVEVKVRRHLMRARKRRGLGWERWTTQWLHGNLGLFNGYRLRRDLRKVVSVA